MILEDDESVVSLLQCHTLTSKVERSSVQICRSYESSTIYTF